MEKQDTNDRAEQMIAALRQRYGDRLSEDEIAEVGEATKAIAQASEDMRTVALEHSDSPFSVPPYRVD